MSMKSTVVCSNARGLPVHSAVTHTHREPITIMQTPAVVVFYTRVPCFIFYIVF